MAQIKDKPRIQYQNRKQTGRGLRFRVVDSRGRELGYFTRQEVIQLEDLHN